MRASAHRYILEFKRPSGTSRGILHTKETWFILLEEAGRSGLGECGLLRGLSKDDVPDYGDQLEALCRRIEEGDTDYFKDLDKFPSIRFGLEQAFLSLQQEDPFELFPSEFTSGEAAIPINGLVWMGDAEFMKTQVREKLDAGFHCIKMKIGAIDFEEEFSILKKLRSEYPASDLEIRVDANGAFSPASALPLLQRLASLELHSIEQPIRAGQWEELATLCEQSPLAIALDEELIGLKQGDEELLLGQVNPHYIILKPSLLGGYSRSEHWIKAAEKKGVGWWVTSALESNVGLNAIAQWTYTLANPMPQGLGTGSLFTNNFESPLLVQRGCLSYQTEMGWQPDIIKQICT